jgi:hypothetical protein
LELSDGQTLFIVLVLIYLSECVLWVRKQSVGFLSPWCRRVRISTALFGNATGGFLFVNPLPPLGSVFLSHLSPLSLSPAGICALNAQALPGVGRLVQSELCLQFDDIAQASTDGAYLLVNDERFVKCATPTQARELAELINQTAKASSASDRERILRAYNSKTFAEDEARKVLLQSASTLFEIRLLGSIFFVFLFVVAPTLMSVYGLLRLFIPVAVVTFVFAIQIAVMFHRGRKLLFEGEARWDQLIIMILCPPAAIRAADLLTRDLLSNYNPIVVAHLLAGTQAQRFIRSFILDLQHPLKHESSNETAAEIIEWSVADQLRQCVAYVEHKKSLKGLLAPLKATGDFNSYCPRCECKFTLGERECPDCPGVGLVVVSENL